MKALHRPFLRLNAKQERPEIAPESTVLVADALSTRPQISTTIHSVKSAVFHVAKYLGLCTESH